MQDPHKEEEGEELEEKPRSFIYHMVRQLTEGQDLTKVLIPTFFLEPRSLLEKYTDLFAHPQLILNVADEDDPVKRMLTVVRWYVSGWHIRPKTCKKPYNPLLGEEFFAYWDHGDSRSDFYAEQVSHHPPVSAIYIENRKRNFTINAHIWSKSKFLGNSAASIPVGEAYLHLNNREEEYVMTFPTYYACGLFFGKLRMELGDKKAIVCKKTGLSTEIEFRTKPLIGGDYNRIRGRIKRDTGKQEVLYTFEGKWDSLIMIKDCSTGKEDVLFDLEKTPVVPKYVTPLDEQGPMESRRAWLAVSKALKRQDHDAATAAKTALEEQQRREKLEREQKGISYQTKMFHKDKNGIWKFDATDLSPYNQNEPVKLLPTEYNKRNLEKERLEKEKKEKKKEDEEDEDNKENKENKETKENKENKESKETKENKEKNKENKEDKEKNKETETTNNTTTTTTTKETVHNLTLASNNSAKINNNSSTNVDNYRNDTNGSGDG